MLSLSYQAKQDCTSSAPLTLTGHVRKWHTTWSEQCACTQSIPRAGCSTACDHAIKWAANSSEAWNNNNIPLPSLWDGAESIRGLSIVTIHWRDTSIPETLMGKTIGLAKKGSELNFNQTFVSPRLHCLFQVHHSFLYLGRTISPSPRCVTILFQPS